MCELKVLDIIVKFRMVRIQTEKNRDFGVDEVRVQLLGQQAVSVWNMLLLLCKRN